MEIIKDDILNYCEETKNNIDVIVNASNSIGYMGGILSRNFKCKGIAESLNYLSKGEIEKEAKQKCKIKNKSYRIFNHLKKGNVFVTKSYIKNCKYIFHAITVTYPGFWSDLNTIDKCCKNIIKQCKIYNINSIVIPLLGCGVGHLNENFVLEIFEKNFGNIKDINIYIIIKKES